MPAPGSIITSSITIMSAPRRAPAFLIQKKPPDQGGFFNGLMINQPRILSRSSLLTMPGLALPPVAFMT